MTIATPTPGLLVIEANEQRQKEFRFNLPKPPSHWKRMLQKNSTFQTLCITQTAMDGFVIIEDVDSPSPVVGVDQLMTQLAIALRSHKSSRVTKIKFCEAPVVELGLLCVAVMESPSNNNKPASSVLLALEFRSTVIDHRAAQTLCCLLEDNVLQDLRLENCKMDGPSTTALGNSLRKNTSLQTFHCPSLMGIDCTPRSIFHAENLSLSSGIRNMLLSNRKNLVQLHVDVPDEQAMWGLVRSATKDHPPSILQRLQVTCPKMTLVAMEAVMMMCWMIPSLQDLHFESCYFTRPALDFVSQTVSDHKILETLAMENCYMWMLPDRYDTCTTCEVNLGKAQVQELSLQGSPMASEFLNDMMDDIGNNPFIRSWNVSKDVVKEEWAFERLLEVVFQQNRGPSELVMDGFECYADRIVKALQHYTSIKVLTIKDADTTELLPFARGIANMSNLCRLTFHFYEDEELSKEFFQALEQGMEQNTSLQSLTIRGLGVQRELAKKVYMPKIRYYLAINRINRIKRNFLMKETVPNGLWAHVLSKTCDEIYFVLTEKPDIITTSGNIAPTRKRKERNDDEGEE